MEERDRVLGGVGSVVALGVVAGLQSWSREDRKDEIGRVRRYFPFFGFGVDFPFPIVYFLCDDEVRSEHY